MEQEPLWVPLHGMQRVTDPLTKIPPPRPLQKKKNKKTGTPPALLSGCNDLAVILIYLINSL